MVDDEPELVKTLARILSARGWSVLTAKNAADALALFVDHAIGVVISDYRMPGMDGVDFLSRVRDQYPDCERILLTAYADVEALNRGINSAAFTGFFTNRVLRSCS